MGICPNCGDVIIGDSYLHPQCHDEYVAYCNDVGSELDHLGGVVDGLGVVHSDADPGL